MSDPITEYGSRLRDRRERTARLRKREDLLSNLRLAFAAVALAIALTPGVAWAWLAIPVLAFAALVVKHEKTVRRRELSVRAERFYERGIARLTDEWPGTGVAGEGYLDPSHPYSEDLDVFGEGSLFELLSTARTRPGEDALAAWLSAPAGIEEVRERQEAVRELRDRMDLREEIALLGEDVRAGIDEKTLAAWGGAPVRLESRWVPLVAAGLAFAAAVGIALYFASMGYLLLATVVLAEILLRIPFGSRMKEVLEGADRPAAELDLMARILARLEDERFDSPRLAGLRQRLETAGLPPSRQVRQLVRLIRMADGAKNQIFAPIAFLVLWELQIAFAIERWRRRSGEAVSRWISAVGEIEALLSLASHAHEHPADPFPELVEGRGELEGDGLAHPLLPVGRAVRNDVALAGDLRLLLVTGSNMSGKSTLLRAVGVNVVLALAGAPVRARSLRLSPLATAATIRIQDSLLEGRSRFFAEIERLKLLMDLTGGETPVLFLLDELLHGTNSHDRAVGGSAVVTKLVEAGAIGFATTHDLALAEIADSLGKRAENVHFADRIVEGDVIFDYQLRPGVVEKGNGLELMRAVGLPV